MDERSGNRPYEKAVNNRNNIKQNIKKERKKESNNNNKKKTILLSVLVFGVVIGNGPPLSLNSKAI